MPWFPDFAGAVELARRQTRAAGLADPVGQYFTALNQSEARAMETVWPGPLRDQRSATREGTPMQATCGSAAGLTRPGVSG
jgi:hypothetical protein